MKMFLGEMMTFNPVRNSLLNIAFLCLLFASLIWVDLHADNYLKYITNIFAVNAILAICFNFIYGIGRIYFIGISAFAAIGAYAYAYISASFKIAQHLDNPVFFNWILGKIDIVFWLGLFCAGLIGLLTSYLLGASFLRLRAKVLLIASIIFSELIRLLLISIDFSKNIDFNSMPVKNSVIINYVCFITIMYVFIRLINSNFGYVLKATGRDKKLVHSLGFDSFKLKFFMLCFAAFFSAIAGALHSGTLGAFTPSYFSFILPLNILLIVLICGNGSITGTIVATFFVTLCSEFFYYLKTVNEIFSLEFLGVSFIHGLVYLAFATYLLSRKGHLFKMPEFTWDIIFNKLEPYIGAKKNV